MSGRDGAGVCACSQGLCSFAADSGLLALSVVGKKGITHTNLYKEPVSELYFTGYHEPVFTTVQELVHAHPLCTKPAETSVYREFCAQFEAARLAAGAEKKATAQTGSSGGLSPRAPESVAPLAPVAMAKRPVASVPDDVVFSPREPMVGTLTLSSTPAVGSVVEPARKTPTTGKAIPAEPQPSPSTDVLPDTGPAPRGGDGAAGSPDAAPIVVAESGITTFDAMHQPAAQAVRDVLKARTPFARAAID